MRRIAGSHFGCCCPHEEMWISAQMKNVRPLHVGCKVCWFWWDFWRLIVNC